MDDVHAYRTAGVTLPNGSKTKTVVGPDGLPAEHFEQYLHWLRARNCSENTVKAYAGHLAALGTWLHARGLAWDDVDFDDLADFMFAMKKGLPPVPKHGGGEREDATLKAVAAAVREFYEHQRVEHRRAPKDLTLSRTVAFSSRTTYHFLAHVEAREAVEVNRLSEGLAQPHQTIEFINFEVDFAQMLDACNTNRDRLALSAYYDLGLRIGQALGLRHEDLDAARKRVKVERRTNNVNNALSKRRKTFHVTSPSRFFDLYREYLLGDLIPAGLDSDYLFVNTEREPVGRPASYSNMFQQCMAIGQRAGLGDVNPHMLRHTHATALAKAGWTAAEIAARLGQEHASTADVYIHLVDGDLDKRLAETAHLIWPTLARKPEEAA